MKPYGNQSGGSGVVAYETEDRAILIRFRNGDTYRYTYERTGQFEVEKMKRLAESGAGLSSYISRMVGDRYDEKL
ncbi:MAG TPA: hypothetical protein VI258_00940 [Rhodanobacteraceae bacterium]